MKSTEFCNLMKPAGSFAGEHADLAASILFKVCGPLPDAEGDEVIDLMVDMNGLVYAVYGTLANPENGYFLVDAISAVRVPSFVS